MGKIYTKSGDKGETGLFGGDRIGKDATRIEAYGSIDELNSVIGLARVTSSGEINNWLKEIQNQLFEAGSELASPEGNNVALHDSHVAEMEAIIDQWQAQLPPLTHFVLPGGSELGSRLHVARTVARRAERAVVRFSREATVRPILLKWLNRLSDALFVAARLANHQSGDEETIWKPSR